ncbi:uncharacterized protein LOC133790559 [Humulus lupulus]|uniref:uncharacterized protein LOC133790559 n=1 Tax=Humulus lupulus TaxID=3486 RepID=UPI002B413F60|nr:uncharacterized protein LOC133790559 [Humulus lupulus]
MILTNQYREFVDGGLLGSVKKPPSYSDVLEALGDSKDIKSIISPTEREKRTPHMQAFISIPGPKSNCMMDMLTTVLEFGGTLNWVNDTDRHAICNNVGVTSEGLATEVGNKNHVQSVSEATRDDTDRHETCDNVGVTNEGQATKVGQEESQGD